MQTEHKIPIIAPSVLGISFRQLLSGKGLSKTEPIIIPKKHTVAHRTTFKNSWATANENQISDMVSAALILCKQMSKCSVL